MAQTYKNFKHVNERNAFITCIYKASKIWVVVLAVLLKIYTPADIPAVTRLQGFTGWGVLLMRCGCHRWFYLLATGKGEGIYI